MKPSSSYESYEFIDSSSDPGIPKGLDTRRRIRRQAMSRVAADRRQKGIWGQHNRRQYPASQLGSVELAEVDNGAVASGSAPVQSTSQGLIPGMEARSRVPASLPPSGYELMRIDYDFDLLDLSALTSFHTGRVTARLLSQDPRRLTHILRYQQRSYFSFLPSRYGHSACLDNAARCVAARVRQWMGSPLDPPHGGVLPLYSKSLNSLQSALNDPVLSLKPETLCATAILAIYELLDCTGSQAWVQHVAGASTLMKLRGPQLYKTDFEKALFLAQAGPIYTEALLNDDRCFLEQDMWQDVFKSVVYETGVLSDSSEIVISLWTIVSAIPSLFKDVQYAVCSSTDIDMPTIRSLFTRLRETRAMLLHWHSQFEQLTFSPNPNSTENFKTDKHYETLGVYLVNMILVNRLSVSLNTHMGSDLEDETQDLARRIFYLVHKAAAMYPRASLFMAFKSIAAQAALDTKDEWHRATRRSVENYVPATPLISSQIFGRWVSLKGRKFPGKISESTGY